MERHVSQVEDFSYKLMRNEQVKLHRSALVGQKRLGSGDAAHDKIRSMPRGRQCSELAYALLGKNANNVQEYVPLINMHLVQGLRRGIVRNHQVGESVAPALPEPK